MLKILHARLQQYMNHALLDVQTGFRKGRGSRGQIADIHWKIYVYAPTSNTEEAEVEQFYEDLQDLLELTPKKYVLSLQGTGMQK